MSVGIVGTAEVTVYGVKGKTTMKPETFTLCSGDTDLRATHEEKEQEQTK